MSGLIKQLASYSGGHAETPPAAVAGRRDFIAGHLCPSPADNPDPGSPAVDNPDPGSPAAR